MSLNLNQIDSTSQVLKMKIEHVSSMRSQGRRFKVTLGRESTVVLFKEIFEQVKIVASQENNIENIKSLNKYLDTTLKKADRDGEDAHEKRANKDTVYAINTWLHRFFPTIIYKFIFGSHIDRINNLQIMLKTKNGELELKFGHLDSIDDLDKKDDQAEKLVSRYLEGNNFSHALQTIHKMSTVLKKAWSLEKVIENPEFRKAEDIENAYQEIEGIPKDGLRKTIALACIKINEIDKAFKMANKISSEQVRNDLFYEMSKICAADKNLEDVINKIYQSNEMTDIEIKNKFIKQTFSANLKNRHFFPDSTFQAVFNPSIPSHLKDDLFVLIIETACTLRDYKKADEVVKYISDKTLKDKMKTKIIFSDAKSRNIIQ